MSPSEGKKISVLGKTGQIEETKKESEITVEETCSMKKFEEYHKNLHAGGGDKGNDSDEGGDEDHGHGG